MEERLKKLEERLKKLEDMFNKDGHDRDSVQVYIPGRGTQFIDISRVGRRKNGV